MDTRKTDPEIVALYFSRDESAVSETKFLYGAHLINLACNLLKSREDAEECVNDAYLKAWNSIPPSNPKDLLAWLARVTRNLCFDRLRENRVRKRSASVSTLSEELAESLPSEEGVERVYEDRQVRRIINAFLERQSPERRFAFVRRYFYGDEYRDIAHYLGKTSGTVRALLHRMRIELKDVLESEGVTV